MTESTSHSHLRDSLLAKLRQNALKKPAMLTNTLPKAISDKLGVEKTAELCIKHGYRSRRSNSVSSCPECGGHNLFFRKGETDGIKGVKCRDCKHVEPIKKTW